MQILCQLKTSSKYPSISLLNSKKSQFRLQTIKILLHFSVTPRVTCNILSDKVTLFVWNEKNNREEDTKKYPSYLLRYLEFVSYIYIIHYFAFSLDVLNDIASFFCILSFSKYSKPLLLV